MQLPRRVLLLNGIITGSPARLLAISLALHDVSLAAIATAPSMWMIGAGPRGRSPGGEVRSVAVTTSQCERHEQRASTRLSAADRLT
jgi:hypothetical protein